MTTRDVVQVEIRLIRKRGVSIERVGEAVDQALEDLFINGFEGLIEGAESSLRVLKETVS